jgi:hypothetical protein
VLPVPDDVTFASREHHSQRSSVSKIRLIDLRGDLRPAEDQLRREKDRSVSLYVGDRLPE